MPANYINKLKQSDITKTLLTGLLSNILIFGQPVKQVVMNYHNPESTTHKHNQATYNTNKNSSDIPKIYYARETKGIIGKETTTEADNPIDNFFNIDLPQSIDLKNYDAVLSYQLYGLDGAAQTTKSINGYPAYGGRVIKKTESWLRVQEYIPIQYLKNGENEIFFNRRVLKNYQYKIKALKIKLKPKDNHPILLSTDTLTNFNGKVQLQGNISNPEIHQLNVHGAIIKVENGVFEKVLKNIPENTRELSISYKTQTGSTTTTTLPIRYKAAAADFVSLSEEHSSNSMNAFLSSHKPQLNYKGLGLSLEEKDIPTKYKTRIKVQKLSFKDIKTIDATITNVTEGKFSAYRIERDNPLDTIPVELALDYDPKKIPKGYTAKDVKTFYFDRKQKSWKALSVDSLDYKNNRVFSKLAKETDYINGVIKVPENPETAGFTPTAMNDIKFADPTAGVVSISPPSANNMGTANTRFPLKLPKGRNGMQPSLTVSYNSSGGNGAMGIGWNLGIPAITLNNKWGAPRFDSGMETELYALDGMDLVFKDNGKYTNPHRDDISRKSNRHFYLRKEDRFMTIIRHGTGPTNYWWETIDKHGYKSYYGGYGQNVVNNAVLKDDNGNIARWGLYRSEDPYGNYVEYHYHNATTSVENSSQSTLEGKEFYIDNIVYTKHPSSNGNYYKVEFEHTDDRPDIITNARNGFLEITKDLLAGIKISYNSQLIRRYQFDYETSKFNKSLLNSIAEKDNKGNLFYENTIEYFDQVENSAIIDNNSTKWKGNNETISPILLNIATAGFADLIPKGSALGTDESEGTSVGSRTGFGIGPNTSSVSNTIGGSYNYSQNTQNTRISFIDINGNGLPDKIYSGLNGVFYRPNKNGSFGNLIKIDGLQKLTETKSKTSGFGFDANAMGLLSVGKSESTTKTDTDFYFVDFNGDGLPDIVGKNRILFNNRKSKQADYTWRSFNSNIEDSENPIVSGAIDPEIVDDMDLSTLQELQDLHPQFDHVKVWKAPYSGNIIINNSAELVSINDDDKNPNDDFRLTIEKTPTQNGKTQLVGSSIILNSAVRTADFTRSVQQVNKGDLFLFRIHNKDYGYGGEVKWNPDIQYSYTSDFPNATTENDETGKPLKYFNAKDDYIMNTGSAWRPEEEDSNVSIDFSLPNQLFNTYQFSDEITFKIEKIEIDLQTGNQQIVNSWERIYVPENGYISGHTNTFNNTLGSNAQYMFRFYATSDSKIRWNDINWKPEISGNSSGMDYPSVSYYTFDNNVNEKKYWIEGDNLVTPIIVDSIPNDQNSPLMEIDHSMFTEDYSWFLNTFQDSEFPLKINWVTKEQVGGPTKTLHKSIFYLYRTSFSPINGYTYEFRTQRTTNPAYNIQPSNPAHSTYFKYVLSKQKVKDLKDENGRIYSAFYIDNKKFGLNNNASISIDLLPNEQQNYNFNPKTLASPFFAQTVNFFGIPYRGWGQFLYNGGLKIDYDDDGNITNTDYFDGNIDMEVFNNKNLSEADAQELQDMIDTDDPDSLDIGESTIRYTLYNQDNYLAKYNNKTIIGAHYGLKENGELTAEVGRFGESNLYDMFVKKSDLLNKNGQVFIGLKQRSKSKGKAKSGDFGIFSGTDSKSTSNVLNQYIDLNGDRYPDIVTNGRIQYTQMHGGLSTKTLSNDFVAGSYNEDQTLGASVAAIHPNSNDESKLDIKNPLIINSKANLNGGSGKTSDVRQWIDINGDGLPDKVIIKKDSIQVYLNTGYGFSDKVTWGSGYQELLTGTRENVAAGAPLPLETSFAIGFGATTGTARGQATLIDVNGDGLPDLVRKYTNNSYSYYLNNGVGFEKNEQIFYEGSRIDHNFSISGNAYGSITFGFPVPIFGIPFKTTVSPTMGVNASFSEKNTTIQDINGDGLPDILSKKNGNGSISARLNQVGKTHLLKKVNTPLGGSWTVNYERKGNTYALPQSKWVMDKVETHDGFTGDNAFGTDETLTSFSYENGNYDRRDRDFYGFESVITEQRDPANNNKTYRYTVQNYHNQNYYLKGMVKETTSYTASDTPLSKTRNFYNMLDPETPDVEVNVTLDQAYQQPNTGELDRTRLFPAVVKTISTSYENGQGLNLVKEFPKYGQHGNLETYINRGAGRADAYKTKISYDNSVYPGLPTKIEVFQNSTGDLLRQRDAAYNSQGKLDEISMHLGNGETNRVQFNYDVFGNTKAITELDNLGGNSGNHGGPIGGNDPFIQNITYDNKVHTFPVKFSDSYGQISTVAYNYLFGMPVLTTDMNSQQMRIRIDNRGRTIEVTGPNELAPNAPRHWTIRNQFAGEAPVKDQIGNAGPDQYLIDNAQGQFTPGSRQNGDAQHYAITRHAVDEAAAGQLLTISIVDGLGQPIQEKKTLFADNTLKWQVGGFQQKDAFGRVTESYLPVVQTPYPSDPYTLSTGDREYFAQNPTGMVDPVEITYDHRDRKLEVTQPGETQKEEFNYGIDSGMFTTTLTNELGQTQKTFTDLRGRQRKTIQNDAITTQFYYNSVNEMTKVIDNNGYKNTYSYDLAGRRTEEMSPDRGLTRFTYDKAGHLIKKQTANLLQSGNTGEIEYTYNFDRLRKTTYPQFPDNNVEYTYGTPDNPQYNGMGRLVKQEDASGIQVFRYGKLGELTGRTRAIAVAGKMAYYFKTAWDYDSWNRIRQITYPDDEKVDYLYDQGGQLKKIERNGTPGNPNAADIVSDITYDDYGQRKQITYGNGTVSDYTYDIRQRLQTLEHSFTNFQIENAYGYDVLSNITSLNTVNPNNSSPAGGALGGPVQYTYSYDDYNRLVQAEGGYVGPNDAAPELLRQEYNLTMDYDNAHNITNKHQTHRQGPVPSLAGDFITSHSVKKTSYELRYENYAEGRFQAGGEGYVQPHAPRKIIQYPIDNYNNDPHDPRIVEKLIDYDADGNMTAIKKKITDPDDPVADNTETLRRYRWDEEDRLRAVDLAPENDENQPEVANYTYDAEGERSIKYVPEGLGAHYSAKDAGRKQHLATMLYPSPLLTVEALDLPIDEDVPADERSLQYLNKHHLTRYTKHYFIGSERINSTIGTQKNLGVLCEPIYGTISAEIIMQINNKVETAGSALTEDYAAFGKEANLAMPYLYSENEYLTFCGEAIPDRYAAFWFHPDHLGSSNYITDLNGNISQHLEYFPFGETLVEEHKNSNNSPYKFNGKELDDETGNYYYGARYLNPKWSFWLSVDPLAEKYPGWSPYNYTLQNPVRLVDPDGKAPEDVIIVFNRTTGKLAITDLDHYQKRLPTKIVSAKDYVHGGIRDTNGKLTHNQILVLEDVFSGGKSTNGVVERDPNKPQQRPIPEGNYDILDDPYNTEAYGNTWYRLDAQDETPLNDRNEATGRDGFRLHLGKLSHGCVTCDISQGDRSKEWDVVDKIMEMTSTKTVKEKRGRQSWNPFSWRTQYGTMIVEGEDNIPQKNVSNE